MNLIKEIKHLYYWIFIAKGSGLNPTPRDDRDFKTGVFKWFGYTPKNTIKINKTLSVKDQDPFNTCQWNATIVQKEPDEKCVLSVRLMVCRGKYLGLVSGDGFSNLRDGQKVLNEWGAVEEGTISDGRGLNWTGYSGINPSLYTERAKKHKTASFWSVSSRNDLLKLLDEGRIVTTGMKWYTGFNQGGGFKAPWLITRAIGYLVGGHAAAIIGYNLNYEGRKVYIIQNSYSDRWGDNGKFYIDMDYLDKNNYGYFVNLDEISVDMGKFFMENDGKNVKGSKSTIYYVQAGKLKPYPDEVTYLAYNPEDGYIKKYTVINDEILNKIATGDKMDIKKSLYWDYLKNIDSKERLNKLEELITGGVIIK